MVGPQLSLLMFQEKERSKLREKLERYTKEGLSQLMTLLDLSAPKGAKKVWHSGILLLWCRCQMSDVGCRMCEMFYTFGFKRRQPWRVGGLCSLPHVWRNDDQCVLCDGTFCGEVT